MENNNIDENNVDKTVRLKSIRRTSLPKIPFNNIAISLSGGGFRATSIHLGVLSYLKTKKLFDTTLLERTRIMSTVSAGTLTGVKYATTLKKGGTFEDCYKSLHDFMSKEELVIEEALNYLSDEKNWQSEKQRSLITSFAAIYHKDFESEPFGILWEEKPIHLKEIIFNATEFNFALPFHFQKAEKSFSKFDDKAHEFIGNRKINIPIEVAKEVRLSDIIAASSCFPFGFEPINFPDDFIHEESVKLKDRTLLPPHVHDGDKITYPIGLMDGGIDDNQGVVAVVAAEERMKNYPPHLSKFRSDDRKAIDLFILSDGTNPSMESYSQNKKRKETLIGKLSFRILRYFGILSTIGGSSCIVYANTLSNKLAIIGWSIFGTIGIVVAFTLFLMSMGFTGLTRRFGVPAFFVKKLNHFDQLKFASLNTLFVNRRNSVTKMISKVFIKQLRWFSFERVYGDPGWKPRLIMNAIFELTEREVEKRKQKYPFYSQELLDPGPEIMLAAAKALTKETTLWFTKAELAESKNMLDTIIACGQFTICFNLLEYYEKFIFNIKYKNDYEKYSDDLKAALTEMHAALLEDWKKFKKNPYWMVNEINQKIY